MRQTNISRDNGEAAETLLKWYDKKGRTLPWRAKHGKTPDVYRVWLSETMLQQTQVATVEPYYRKFIKKWPNLEQLAKADRDDVLRCWAGLGYYARARNLYACAQTVANEHNGVFPDNEESLRSLPGIGPYTAAAIMAIAYDQPAVVVDGNVARIMARLYKVNKPIQQSRTRLENLAARHSPQHRPGDYAQAIMDLGAVVCTPRSPKCVECPWSSLCEAHATGKPENWPRKKPKRSKPRCYGVVFWIERPDGAVALRRRPDDGLLGGMLEVPNSGWHDRPLSEGFVGTQSPMKTQWVLIPGLVRHSFTHFDLEVTIFAGRSEKAPDGTFWCPKGDIESQALPSLMRKVVTLVQMTEMNLQ